MPQPLSSVAPDANYRFGVMTLPDHADLAPYVAQVIHIGTMIEHYSTMMLAGIAHADPEAVLAMHTAVSSASAQRAMLETVAAAKLQKPDNFLFQAVQKAGLPARKIRNDFAHHIWADSREVPNALLLINPKALIEFKLPFLKPFTLGETIYRDIDRSKIMVYREDDLKDAADTVHLAFSYIAGFKMMIDEKKPQARAQMHVALSSVPAIADALGSLRHTSGS
jgi:hypothetical protein